MKAKKPILFPLKKRHGEFESSMRGSAHKIQKTRNLFTQHLQQRVGCRSNIYVIVPSLSAAATAAAAVLPK